VERRSRDTREKDLQRRQAGVETDGLVEVISLIKRHKGFGRRTDI
jgi:hypothetical protein